MDYEDTPGAGAGGRPKPLELGPIHWVGAPTRDAPNGARPGATAHDGDAFDEDTWDDQPFDDEAFDDEAFDDEAFDDDRYHQHSSEGSAVAPVALRSARRSTGARLAAVVVAVVLAALLAANVLLWQRVEDTRTSRSAPRTVTITGLADVQRRLSLVEAQISLAAAPNGATVTPAPDPLRYELDALKQCVLQFQQAMVDISRGRRGQITYC